MEFSSSAEQNFMKRLLEVIDANLHDENFGVAELAAELGMSRSTLHRKVKSVVNKSVNEFIRETRLNRAHNLLEKKNKTVSEIAYEVGFRSVSYFNRAFRDQFGYTPGDVLKGNYKSIKETSQKSTGGFRKRYRLFAVVVIAVVLALSILLRIGETAEMDNIETIAVLPLGYEQSQENDSHNAEWIVREIINELEKVENIAIVPYSDVSNYNTATKSIRTIGQELKVNYLLNGSVIQSDEQLKIHFEFTETKTGTLIWQEILMKPIDFKTMAEAFTIQKEVAQKVVDELKITLTPEDKADIATYPTTNTDAFKKYVLANELLHRVDGDWDDVWEAKLLLQQAISLDSTFSDALSLMGNLYNGHLYFTPDLYRSAAYLDTGRTYFEKALTINPNDKNALGGLWKYYNLKGQPEEADRYKHWQDNRVRNYRFYIQEFSNYYIDHPVRKLEAFYNYLELKPEDMVIPWWILEHVYEVYMRMGFPELARKYCNEMHMIQFKGPVPRYCYHTALIKEYNGNYDSAFVDIQKAFDTNPGEKHNYLLLGARNAMRQRNFNEACTYLDQMEKMVIDDENWLEMLSHLSRLMYPFGYSYLMTGQMDKGEYYLKRLVKRYEDEIETNWVLAQIHYTYIELAMTYSALGEEDKALQCLSAVLDKGACQLWFILELENNPMFDNIRDRAEYDSFLEAFKNNYTRERRWIEKLLIKKGIRPA